MGISFSSALPSLVNVAVVVQVCKEKNLLHGALLLNC